MKTTRRLSRAAFAAGIVLAASITLHPSAASANTPGAPGAWSIRQGTAYELSGPAAYQGTWSHTFSGALTKVAAETTNVRYYLIAGKLVNGHYSYTPQFAVSPGAIVEAQEVAIDTVRHMELFAIGQFTPATASAWSRTHTASAPGTARYGKTIRSGGSRGRSDRLFTMATGYSSAQVNWQWEQVNLGYSVVVNTCEDQGYNYNSSTYMIANVSGGSCGTLARTEWEWYIVPGSVSYFGPNVFYNGSQAVEAAVGQNASMTWPCMYNDTNCYNGTTPDCQIDYNSNVLTGYVSGNQYETGNSQIWTPSGRENCEYLFVDRLVKAGNMP